MISLVLATYNGEKFIEKQLTSILKQTMLPDEVFIADDCSNDKTPELVKAFIAKHNLSNWHFEVNQVNQGYKQNFYNLLQKVSGDLVFLADQDDEWYAQKIAKMTTTIKDNPEILALCSTVELIDGQSKKIDIPKIPNLYNANFTFSKKPLTTLNFFNTKSIMAANISPGCSMCITKKLNETFLKTYNFKMPHDWHMTLLASLKDGCCLLNEPLIGYRLHGNNTIGSTTGGGIRGSLKNFKRKEKIIEFTERLETFAALQKYYNLYNKDLTYIRQYTQARLNFYQKPSLFTLKKLRDYEEYYMTSKKKGRMFDLLVALHVDWILYLAYGEKRM